MNPETGRFEPISQELMTQFAKPEAEQSAEAKQKRNWTRFQEDEVIHVRGIAFRVAQIEPTRLVLRPIVREA